MKHILLVTLEYPPAKGGVASYYGGLVEELRRQGHEVEVVSSGLLSKWMWPRWAKGYFLVRKAIKGDRASGQTEARSPDVVFVGHVLPLGTIAYLLRRRVPYVVFVHGMDVMLAQKSWRKRWLVKKIVAHAKSLVANSEFTKIQVGSIISDRKKQTPTLVVYPCPTIRSDVKQEDVEALRRRLGLTGKKVLLTLGRVVERKGHDMVIRALPEILRQVANVVYVVAGAGPYLEKLGALVEELKLQTTVRFVGKVSDEERPLYYSLCDIFVMPTRQIGPDVEGFGLSFLEAALFGKTAVGGASGGVGEAIVSSKTGYLVDPTNPGAIARAIVHLLQDDALRTQLGQNAKVRVAQEFTWEKQVEKLLKNL